MPPAQDTIERVLEPAGLTRPADVISMQFCMHYAFETESKARQMLANVMRYLKPGGVFLGTIPDSSNLIARLEDVPQDAEELQFGNEVYRVRFDERGWGDMYGHRYTFFLQDAVEEVPEYVVYWDAFVESVAPLLLSALEQVSRPVPGGDALSAGS